MSGPDLNLVHRIDQAQASAFARIDTLLEFINDWLQNQGFTVEQIFDAVDDPMMFMGVVQLLKQRVDVHEFPNLMAAAIVKIVKVSLEGVDDGGSAAE